MRDKILQVEIEVKKYKDTEARRLDVEVSKFTERHGVRVAREAVILQPNDAADMLDRIVRHALIATYKGIRNEI